MRRVDTQRVPLGAGGLGEVLRVRGVVASWEWREAVDPESLAHMQIFVVQSEMDRRPLGRA